jgi:hypothetical protein
MKKLKDLIYDYNDVVVALLIIIAAGLIIFWRVNTVMAYPKYAAEYATTSTGIDIDFSDVDLNQDPVDNQQDPGEDPTAGGETSASAIEGPTSGPGIADPGNPTEGAVEPPALPAKVTLTISRENKNGSWQAVGNWLLENNIISDKAEFIARVEERKVSTKLQLGTFEFSTGMTLDEVIDKLI